MDEERTNGEAWKSGVCSIRTPAGDFVVPEDTRDFPEAVKMAARFSGLSVFRVFTNGTEVQPSACPATVQEVIDQKLAIRVEPYDRAG